MCYDVKETGDKFTGARASLSDQYEANKIFDVKKPGSLCAPANKNEEDPSAPSHPLHLQAHQLKLTKTNPPQVKPGKHENIKVENQFGVLIVDTVAPDRLLVPTTKSLAGPVPPPANPDVDHFTCYTVKVNKKVCEADPTLTCRTDAECASVGGVCNLGFPKGLRRRVQDQFQDRVYDVKKPTRLCVPTAKDVLPVGDPEPILHPADQLMCYQAKLAKNYCESNPSQSCKKDADCGEDRCVLSQDKHDKTPVYTNNQFGPEQLETIKEEELCVPPPPPPGTQCDPTGQPPIISAARADLNDDGMVDGSDIDVLLAHLGKRTGEVGYLDGLDLASADPNTAPNAPDGVIDQADIDAVRGHCGVTGIAAGPTTVKGFVLDLEGNPLPDVTVEAGTTPVVGASDSTGGYNLDITDSGDRGVTEITFRGSTATDPTSGGSGQYPTIPHKPIFINGGVDNTFRVLHLPERDLTGAVTLDDSNSTDAGLNARTLTQDILVDNTSAGVNLNIPAGCTVTFPDGEPQELSITRMDPARLPVAPPPGMGSTLFVTYQPGGSNIQCPEGTQIFSEFANTDGFALSDTPTLNGVIDGAFQPIVGCTVEDADNNSELNDVDDIVRCGPLPLPFDFAWYATFIPGPPCPLTIVTGRVVCNGVPVANAEVTLPGQPPCSSQDVPGDPAHGVFGFINIPAGPNGPFCLTNPFSYQVRAFKDLNGNGALDPGEVNVSAQTDAVPGGVTNVGDIDICATTGAFPGDLVEMSVAEGTINNDPTPFVFVSLHYTAPIPGGFENSLDLLLEFDLDEDPLTGQSSFIFSPDGGTNLGVDAVVQCFGSSCFLGGIGSDSLVLGGAGPNVPFGFLIINGEVDYSRPILSIPKAELFVVIPGSDPDFNMALQSTLFVETLGQNVSDVVPNGGNLSFTLPAVDTRSDPTGDTFEPQGPPAVTAQTNSAVQAVQQAGGGGERSVVIQVDGRPQTVWLAQ
jgi:hypothetical protein